RPGRRIRHRIPSPGALDSRHRPGKRSDRGLRRLRAGGRLRSQDQRDNGYEDGRTRRKNPGPKRVAFGNGVFVVVGEKGLIARTKDGKTWDNNRTRDDVGDVQCVEFNGKDFLLTHTDPKTKTTRVM